jgi:hypothetical protein
MRWCGALLAAVLLSACGSPATKKADDDTPAPAATPTSSAPRQPGTGTPEGEGSGAGAPSPSVTLTEGSRGGTRTPTPPASDDAAAGVLSRQVPDVGTGKLVVVKGASSAPAKGKVRTVRISVEGGLPADGDAFAGFVLRTLNDPRGWTRDGYTFARTDAEADTEVVLASPRTSAQMCRPLQTNGTLSCRNGQKVIFTWYRWVNGQEDFGGDLTLYRQYLVNHEVGHFLGHGHQSCPGAGKRAPVMMQQTKGVKPCKPNAWPYPDAS